MVDGDVGVDGFDDLTYSPFHELKERERESTIQNYVE
jgi:hypothetical protein